MTTLFRDPAIADGEKSVYAVSVGDSPSTSQLTNLIEHDGDAYVSSIDAGSADSYRLEVEQRINRAGGVMLAESYRAVSRFAGELVSREEGYFTGTQHMRFGGALGPFPNGTMPLLGCATLLRGLDFHRGAKTKHELWLAYSVCWPLDVHVEKRTRITVGAGSFDTWQVSIRPSFSHINGILDKVIAGVLPPFVLHFDVRDSHRMVRFSFPSGPLPWQPRCLLELAD